MIKLKSPITTKPRKSGRWNKIIFLLLFTFLIGNYLFVKQLAKTSMAHNADTIITDSIISLKIFAVGDAMAHLPQITSAYDNKTKTWDFVSVFQYFKPILKNFDLNLVNYETTAAGEPYKGYPQFCAPDTFMYALSDAGFNYFVNANNHSADRGLLGINRTIDVFKKYNLRHTGTFKHDSIRAKTYPDVFYLNGIKIAILNCTYGTNGLPIPSPAIVNLIDTNQIKKDLKKAKDSMPDFIITSIHWGDEYKLEPNNQQKKWADFLFENGTDIIIGSHPHVVQPVEISDTTYNNIKKKRLIIWSLGNFVSNQQRLNCDGGIGVAFTLQKNIFTGKTWFTNVCYLPLWVYVSDNPKKYFVIPGSIYENDTTTIKMKTERKQAFKLFLSNTRNHLKRDTNNIKEYFPVIN